MNSNNKNILLNHFNALAANEVEHIQTLWSGYGNISRVELLGSDISTVITKNIILPSQTNHPRGWNTDISHQRKLKSYLIEIAFYKQYASRCNNQCRVAKYHTSTSQENEHFIVLEDLDAAGFPIRKSSLDENEIKVCLSWLAHFHAIFMDETPSDLWNVGTYWHLATRPDELAEMKDGKLKEVAHLIDQQLTSCQYKTFVHGDAKVANFCFSKDLKEVAAVDFQYVGGGCGMKDVIYLLGSCMNDSECEQNETALLNYYFSELEAALIIQKKNIDFKSLEKEWRLLYPVAWTDFTRFLLGWMPTHNKLNNYSLKLSEQVLDSF